MRWSWAVVVVWIELVLMVAPVLMIVIMIMLMMLKIGLLARVVGEDHQGRLSSRRSKKHMFFSRSGFVGEGALILCRRWG